MSQSNECIDYLERANDCTYPSILRKNCNEYFYLDRRDNKFKKCRKSASKSKNCRDPFNDPEPSKLSGTSICKDQDDAKKRKQQHDKEIAEYMETKRLEELATIRQQEEHAKNKRKQHVELINKNNVKKLSEKSANIYIETGQQDEEFGKALDKYLQKVVPENLPGESVYITIDTSPPTSGNSQPDPPLSEDEQTEVGEFRPRPYAAGGKKKRKSRKSRKVRKSRKPRKSKRNRRKSTRNKKAGRWVVMPRQPGDPPTYIRMQWIDEYTTDDEEE